MWSDLLRVLGMVLIIEGLWPFISPSRWRSLLVRVIAMDDWALRLTGVISIGLGLVLLRLFKG